MIEPRIGTSHYKIGTPFDDIDFSNLNILEVEDREILKVYKSDYIWFFFNSKTNKLDQISVFHPFEEKVLDKVGIGDTLADVYKHFGKCQINFKVHEPHELPGIAFETEKGSKSKT